MSNHTLNISLIPSYLAAAMAMVSTPAQTNHAACCIVVTVAWVWTAAMCISQPRPGPHKRSSMPANAEPLEQEGTRVFCRVLKGHQVVGGGRQQAEFKA